MYVHAGLEGSVIALTNVLGELVEKYRYTAFGLLTVLDAEGEEKATPALSPWLYHGRLFEEASGLYWMRMRHYSPQLGRFLQPDPAGIAGGINLYAYSNNNPLRYFDPWGLWPAPDASGSSDGKYGEADPSRSNGNNDGQKGWNSPDEAAKAALDEFNQRSIEEMKEYGGYIYEYDGKYYFTKPVVGNFNSVPYHQAESSVPDGGRIVGDFHTHGDFDLVDSVSGHPLKGPNDSSYRASDLPHGHPCKSDDDKFSPLDNLGTKWETDRRGDDYTSYLGTPRNRYYAYSSVSDSTRVLKWAF